MKNIIRSGYWYGMFAISLFTTWFSLKRLLKIKGTISDDEYDWKVFEISNKWAKGQLKRAGCHVEVSGNTNYPDGPVLFVSNHQSNFDTGLIMSHVNKPTGYVAKESISKAPVLKTWMLEMHSIFLDREDTKKSARAILDGIKILKGGHSLTIYPEGTRSKSNKMSEFKDGAFILAIKAKVPIIPITVCDTHKMLEANNNLIIPHTTYIHIHDPISVDGMTKKDLPELSSRVHKEIETKLIELDKK